MKAIKIVEIIIVVCVVLVVGGCSVILGIMNYRNKNYWKYTETKGEIEKQIFRTWHIRGFHGRMECRR